MIYAVCGKPVLHSKSPLIFNNYFKSCGSSDVYTRIAAESGYEIISFLRSSGIAGCNVTAPFKDQVIPFLDRVDDEALRLQSVNTIINRNGVLTGFSTDSYGVYYTLLNCGKKYKDKRAVLLGAGGAARAAAVALDRLGLKVTVVNRTFEKAVSAAHLCGGTAVTPDNAEEAIRKADVVINTLLPEVDIIKSEWFKKDVLALDAIYKESVFQQKAKKAGVRYVRGEEWLYYQADRAAEHFFGKRFGDIKPPESFMEPVKIKTSTITLTGFMGSGKSSIAKNLAFCTGIPCYDMDEIIENSEGISITDIFQTKGEEWFRQKECELLEKLCENNEKKIISCGGGVVTRKANRDILRKKCLNIWIYADMDKSLERVANTNRPLASDGAEQFKALFESRKELYAGCADMTIINSDKDVNQSVRRINEEICEQIIC
ncbi:MAG: cytidylate kinase family protein [Spirochaetes bacterium]|nr:cytidylate kinase family protein [Spirochaetota bacterium]MBN2770499.1 cytidylate kinase family protein [Spirochaetota bacterium]